MAQLKDLIVNGPSQLIGTATVSGNPTTDLGIVPKQYVDNGFTKGNARVFYGTCDTVAATTAKVVSCSSYDGVLTNGDTIIVKFASTNTGAVGSLTLAINNGTTTTTAKNIKKSFSDAAAQNLSAKAEINAGTIQIFTYNGTYWILMNSDYDSNTNTVMRTYASTTDINVPLLSGNATNSTTVTWTDFSDTYKSLYGSIPNDTAKQAKINLSTGKISIPGGLDTGSSNITTTGNIAATEVKGYVTIGQNTNETLGSQATAEGEGTIAAGTNSHAEGYCTMARGAQAHTEGGGITNAGFNGIPFIHYNVTITVDSEDKVEIISATKNGSSFSLAESDVIFYDNKYRVIYYENNMAQSSAITYYLNQSFNNSDTTLENCVIYRYYTSALGGASHAEGLFTIAAINYSHAEGYFSKAFGVSSHAEGRRSLSIGEASHSEGINNIAYGNYSHAEGGGTYNYPSSGKPNIASGAGAHVEGYCSSEAAGDGSHAEGHSTQAKGNYSHAEGDGTRASAYASHAEGKDTYAFGTWSHAEGYNSRAGGIVDNELIGEGAHAEGWFTEAKGDYSHVEGYWTIASGECQHVFGRYNIEDTYDNYVEIVGNGNDSTSSNARTLDWSGNETLAGSLILKGSSIDLKISNRNDTLFFTKKFNSGGGGTVDLVQVTSNGYLSTAGGVKTTAGLDYAERRIIYQTANPGNVVIEKGDGTLVLSTQRLQKAGAILSDTYGMLINDNNENSYPVAVAGRVLAYPDKDSSTFEVGAPVCTGPNGTVSQMTEEEERLYPSRIIGVVSEIPTYKVWLNGKQEIQVNGRIWIRVK